MANDNWGKARRLAQSLAFHKSNQADKQKEKLKAQSYFLDAWARKEKPVVEATFTEYARVLSESDIEAVISSEPGAFGDQHLHSWTFALPDFTDDNGALVIAAYILRPNLEQLNVVGSFKIGDEERGPGQPINVNDLSEDTVRKQLDDLVEKVVNALS